MKATRARKRQTYVGDEWVWKVPRMTMFLDAPEGTDTMLPAWVYDIDAYQVGLDNHGVLVAYDV